MCSGPKKICTEAGLQTLNILKPSADSWLVKRNAALRDCLNEPRDVGYIFDVSLGRYTPCTMEQLESFGHHD